MATKSKLLYPFALLISRRIRRWSKQAVDIQEGMRQGLVEQAKHTAFGKTHHFDQIKTYEDFKAAVPICDYEALRPYIERIKQGESDVLWTGKPKYFAKTSGTTSGIKYIPITKESIPNHFNTARNALLHYAVQTGNRAFLDGKMIFLSGSPELEKVNGILTGRLSGISNHLVPKWLKGNQLPSWETNCIEEWEEKLDRIVEETVGQDLRLISGIPPWVQMYYERLLAKTGKQYIKDIFPNFSVFVYGGVNFEPYRNSLEALVGKSVDSVETYPASEGFVAFQDQQDDKGLLLNVQSGIFFEFVSIDELSKERPERLSLGEVELGVNYALIINNNAGLWGYNLGDMVQFTSLSPYRIVVSGRVKHFISAFGEHVIGKEVEEAMLETSRQWGGKVTEFTVAPRIQPEIGNLPYHEWYIEFEEVPKDLTAFSNMLDKSMQKQNIYYEDLIKGGILQPLRLKLLQRGTFRNYMKTQGKLGGQNKVPRLSNDRKIADVLEMFKI